MLKLFSFIIALLIHFLTLSQGFECGCSQLRKENYELSKLYFGNYTKNEFLKNSGLSKYYFFKGHYKSAYQYANSAIQIWENQPNYIRVKASKCQIDSSRLQEIKQLSAGMIFEKIKRFPTVGEATHFISFFQDFNSLQLAIDFSDSLLLHEAISTKKSRIVDEFIITHNNSKYVSKAKEAFCELQYKEEVLVEELKYLESFVVKFPLNCKIEQVQYEIYKLYEKQNDIETFKQYLLKYPDLPWISQAWRQIFNLYVGEWDIARISQFISEYPNYPYLDELNRDLELLSEELYPFKKNELFGYMNEKGNIVIPPTYTDAGFFKNGRAVVMNKDYYGAINKRNQIVIPFQFESLYDFNQDVAIASDSLYYGLISKNGTILVPFQFEEIRQINPLLYIFQNSNGYMFYNQKGLKLKDEIFEEISVLSNGDFKCVKNDLTGILDSKLNEKIQFQYEEVEMVNDTLFIVKQNGKFGISGIKNNLIVQPIYERLKIVNLEKSLMIVKKGKEFFLLKFNGTKYLNSTFTYSSASFDLFSFFHNNTVIFQKGKFGIMDINGKIICKPIFDELGPISYLTPFKSNGLWGFMENSNVKITPSFNEQFKINMSYFLVEKLGKQGIIDSTGKQLINVDFSSIKFTEGGYFITEDDGLMGIFNKNGTMIVPCNYDYVKILENDLILLQEKNEIRYFIPSKSLIIKAKNE